MQKTKWKSLLTNLVLMGVVFVLLCIAMEVTLRLLNTQSLSTNSVKSVILPIYDESETLSWKLSPGSTARYDDPFGEFNVSYQINSLGYRYPEFEVAKPPKTYRILSLGDSFAFGAAVEENETYSSCLERHFNNQSPTHFSVISMGVSGYSPDLEYLSLKENGLKLNPDFVLLAFYIGNDFTDLESNAWETDKKGDLTAIRNTWQYVDQNHTIRNFRDANRYMPKTFKDLIFEGNRFLSSHSYFYMFIKDALRSRVASVFATIYYNGYSEQINQDVNRTFYVFNLLKRLTEEGKIPLMIILVPQREQVYGVPHPKGNDLKLNWTKPNEILVNWGRENNVTVLDLLPKLKGYLDTHSNATLYHLKNDNHFNPKGTEVACRFMFDKLSEKIYKKKTLSSPHAEK